MQSMINFLVISPVLLPLLTAGITVLLRYRQSSQYWVGLLASALILLNHLMIYASLQTQHLSSDFGGWSLPYGIGFQIDTLSYIMLTISAIMTFSSLL